METHNPLDCGNSSLVLIRFGLLRVDLGQSIQHVAQHFPPSLLCSFGREFKVTCPSLQGFIFDITNHARFIFVFNNQKVTQRCIYGRHIRTYIIDRYKPLVTITTQLLIALMLCTLILYLIGRAQSLKSTPNNSFLRNFMTILFTLRVLPEIC